VAVAWLALALLGQLAALLLIEAGPVVAYQHYPAVADTLEGWRPVLLAALGVQAALVAWLGRRRWAELRAWIAAREARPWRWIVPAAVVACTAAAPSRSLARYAFETAFATGIEVLGLLTLLLFAVSLRPGTRAGIGARFDRLLGPEARREGPERPAEGQRLDRLTLVCALWAVVTSALLGRLSYEWFPHIPDEVAYVLQSRYMAHGWLGGVTLPVPEAFTPEMVLVGTERWASIFPPGWPALLAIGQRIDLPWLVNPLLAGLCVVLTRLLVGETHGRRTARLAVLLLSVSPWFLLMAMSFMSHIASMACALLGAWAVARARRGAGAFALVAGACVGALSLIRPLEGVMGGLILGVWAIWPRGRGSRPARAALFGAATIAVGSVNFAYNRAVTGSAREFPIMAYSELHYPPGANALGFGPERGFGWPGLDPLPGHGPADVVLNADLNGFAVNVELFGWVTGSVLLLALFLLLGRPGRRDLAYLAAAGVVVAIQSLYWFSGGPDFGARYWYLILLPCVLLTARGIEWLRGTTRDTGIVPAFVGGLVLLALVAFVPWRAIDKYHGYRGMRPGLEGFVEARGIESDALVLIRGRRQPDFHAAVLLDPVDGETGGRLYAWEADEGTRAALETAFPGRRIWVLEGPSVTGGGYRVVERPEGAP